MDKVVLTFKPGFILIDEIEDVTTFKKTFKEYTDYRPPKPLTSLQTLERCSVVIVLFSEDVLNS